MNPVTTKTVPVRSPKNTSAGRIKGVTGPATSVTKGSLAPRNSAPIINGH